MDAMKTPVSYFETVSLPCHNSRPLIVTTSSPKRSAVSAARSGKVGASKDENQNGGASLKVKLAAWFSSLDDLIHKHLDLPLRPAIDPRHVLAGNFAPVGETPPTKCEVVEGALPPCLNGVFIRNGPNPQFPPRGPHHLFEGDGMLQSVRISDGQATFCSRYVQTQKYRVEREMGRPVIFNLYSACNGVAAALARLTVDRARRLTGLYNPADGTGRANTSLCFFGSSLYALEESDAPYAVRVTPDGDITTVGRSDFNGELFKCMTAHPKLDPDTGELFAFRYGAPRPFLTYFRFDPSGEKQAEVPVSSLDRLSYFHDFAVTKRYAIFCETQIGLSPVQVLKEGGPPISADLDKVPRLGIIPRYNADELEMVWLDAPGFNMLHVVNAWDEEEMDEVVLIGSNFSPIEQYPERMDLLHLSMEMVRISLGSGTLSRRPVSSTSLDLAVINPSYVGKKNRYVYASILQTEFGDPMAKIGGVLKLDLSKDQETGSVSGIRIYTQGCFGGEPFYVARDPKNAEADEDDGYLVTYIHDETTGESRFLVMDAKSPSLEIIAAVKLPQRVPYGFHSIFVLEEDLDESLLSSA